MRCGDDDAGGERVRAGEEGDSGGGDDAGGFDGRSGGGEAGGECSGDPVRGFAGILADENSWWLVSMVPPQMVGEGEADGVDRRGIERRLAGNATNAVGSEEFLHIDTGY
jgi:hypothetical protein